MRHLRAGFGDGGIQLLGCRRGRLDTPKRGRLILRDAEGAIAIDRRKRRFNRSFNTFNPRRILAQNIVLEMMDHASETQMRDHRFECLGLFGIVVFIGKPEHLGVLGTIPCHGRSGCENQPDNDQCADNDGACYAYRHLFSPTIC